MIDTHSHILPSLDDGSKNVEQSLRMAADAKEEGIITIIATPHHLTGKFENPANKVERAVSELNIEFEQQGVALKVLPGQEVRLNGRFFQEWEAGTILTLNRSKYILVEFESEVQFDSMGEWIHELLMLGLIPIIAHPERIPAVIEEPERILELIEAGAFCQVTTPSIEGQFGRKAQKTAERLCRERWIHFLASDAHHPVKRSYHMQSSLDKLKVWAGEDWASYVSRNPERVIHDQKIECMLPKIEKKKWFRRFTRSK